MNKYLLYSLLGIGLAYGLVVAAVVSADMPEGVPDPTYCYDFNETAVNIVTGAHPWLNWPELTALTPTGSLSGSSLETYTTQHSQSGANWTVAFTFQGEGVGYLGDIGITPGDIAFRDGGLWPVAFVSLPTDQPNRVIISHTSAGEVEVQADGVLQSISLATPVTSFVFTATLLVGSFDNIVYWPTVLADEAVSSLATNGWSCVGLSPAPTPTPSNTPTPTATPTPWPTPDYTIVTPDWSYTDTVDVEPPGPIDLETLPGPPVPLDVTTLFEFSSLSRMVQTIRTVPQLSTQLPGYRYLAIFVITVIGIQLFLRVRKAAVGRMATAGRGDKDNAKEDL